ncbi:DUF1499 domain-containing protein [Roseibium sp.]|uniref:DUF1499 domain-containing protein n=1 Tax=Roseibium sp. TaxID=1936156 RepID=UPI003D0EB31A
MQFGFGSSWVWGLGALVLVLCGIGAALFFRLVPVTEADVPQIDAQTATGDLELSGGHYAVRSLEAVSLFDLERQIVQTVRTRRISGSSDNLPMVFVHRSKIWGFPDVTQVWVENGHVHVYSHLVFGNSDLGVNRARMDIWLSAFDV